MYTTAGAAFAVLVGLRGTLQDIDTNTKTEQPVSASSSSLSHAAAARRQQVVDQELRSTLSKRLAALAKIVADLCVPHPPSSGLLSSSSSSSEFSIALEQLQKCSELVLTQRYVLDAVGPALDWVESVLLDLRASGVGRCLFLQECWQQRVLGSLSVQLIVRLDIVARTDARNQPTELKRQRTTSAATTTINNHQQKKIQENKVQENKNRCQSVTPNLLDVLACPKVVFLYEDDPADIPFGTALGNPEKHLSKEDLKRKLANSLSATILSFDPRSKEYCWTVSFNAHASLKEERRGQNNRENEEYPNGGGGGDDEDSFPLLLTEHFCSSFSSSSSASSSNYVWKRGPLSALLFDLQSRVGRGVRRLSYQSRSVVQLVPPQLNGYSELAGATFWRPRLLFYASAATGTGPGPRPPLSCPVVLDLEALQKEWELHPDWGLADSALLAAHFQSCASLQTLCERLLPANVRWLRDILAAHGHEGAFWSTLRSYSLCGISLVGRFGVHRSVPSTGMYALGPLLPNFFSGWHRVDTEHLSPVRRSRRCWRWDDPATPEFYCELSVPSLSSSPLSSSSGRESLEAETTLNVLSRCRLSGREMPRDVFACDWVLKKSSGGGGGKSMVTVRFESRAHDPSFWARLVIDMSLLSTCWESAPEEASNVT